MNEIDPSKIGYLVIDEANSKKVYTEVMLSVARKLLKSNPDMKLVILGTSLDKEGFNNYFKDIIKFDSTNIIEVPEKNYLTETKYQSMNGEVDNKVGEVLRIIEEEIYRQAKRKRGVIRDANILIFLSGAKEA